MTDKSFATGLAVCLGKAGQEIVSGKSSFNDSSDPLLQSCLTFLSRALYPLGNGTIGIHEDSLYHVANALANYIEMNEVQTQQPEVDRSFMTYFASHNASVTPTGASLTKEEPKDTISQHLPSESKEQ